MTPGLRDHFIDMIEPLRAEWQIMTAQVMRVAQADQDSYESFMIRWEALAEGKQIGEDIDERGRPITDNLDDFIGFVHFDADTIAKYGQSLYA